MNYGFVVDNRKCIGCHACSTACKSENEVPLGVYRTWVKSVEHGVFPDVTRSFQVTRCNHCENPPCVRICPVTAMYQRDDGIVEFDKDICIGCKACMQACPYDAIHIDPDSGTAAKCHYCSHRTETGLEPACAVVCPTHAIIAGDLDDPFSEIAKMVAGNKTTVRKPEQGTSPNVFYIDGEDIAMRPTALVERPEHMSFSEVITDQGVSPRKHLPVIGGKFSASGTALRAPQAQGLPLDSGPRRPRRAAEQMAALAYNAQHKVPWHWQVPAYLVTKAIGTGAFMLLAIGLVFGLFTVTTEALVWGGLLGLVATVATTGLLVADLERPERFLSIILRPQWRSWLTRGAFILIGFSTLAGIWWAAETAAWLGYLTLGENVRLAFAWTVLPLSLGAAAYTAFLFAQAEGRDLWQSPLLPFHLLVQAMMMGAGGLVLLGGFELLDPELLAVARICFGTALVVDIAMILFGEFGVAHASEVAALAAYQIHSGRYRKMFWGGAVVLGHAVPVILLAAGVPLLGVLAALAAGVGLYYYEYAFVMAPQEIPNS